MKLGEQRARAKRVSSESEMNKHSNNNNNNNKTMKRNDIPSLSRRNCLIGFIIATDDHRQSTFRYDWSSTGY